jgi:hypothetical protein
MVPLQNRALLWCLCRWILWLDNLPDEGSGLAVLKCLCVVVVVGQ